MIPTRIVLHRASRVLEVAFADDNNRFQLPAEYLRVFSPSAEVQGHGTEPMRLIAGKRDVAINAVEPVGRYGVLLRFDDGHASGIFSWHVLYRLGTRYDENWRCYLDRLAKAGLSRSADTA